jgi:hypothetical protein
MIKQYSFTSTSFTFSGGAAVSASTLTQTIVQAARRADITGATRQYLALSCPVFYLISSSSASDPSCSYASWTNSVPPASFSTTSYGFAPQRVQNTPAGVQNIMNWAQYAAVYDSNGNPTTPLISGTSLYNQTNPSDPLGRTYGQIARDFGPGTILNPSVAVTSSFSSTIYPTPASAPFVTTKTCSGPGGITGLPSTIYNSSSGWAASPGGAFPSGYT